MTAPVITPPIGSRQPTYSHIPDGDETRGDDAVAFARLCGMTLFPWQEDVLRNMCKTDDKGHFAASEVVVSVPRQNGKGEILVARELAGIFLFGEKVILHTAHHLDTAIAARERLWEVVEANDFLMTWWSETHKGTPRQFRSNGKENIEFPNGSVILFRTRSDKTARGLTVNLVILDEAFELPAQRYAAINSTTAAVAGSQIIFISSPVDRFEHIHGAVFSAKRWQGFDGSPSMYYAEWCAKPDDDIHTLDAWKRANPSLVEDSPVGVQLKFIKQNSDTAKNSAAHKEQFLVENLGVGNWYPKDGAPDEDNPPIFKEEDIDKILTTDAVKLTGQVLSVDAHPNRENIGISICGKTTDNTYHIHTGYLGAYNLDAVKDMLINLINKVDPELIVIDGKNPANLVESGLADAGFEVEKLTYKNVLDSTQLFMQLVDEDRLTITNDERGIARKALEDIRLRQTKDGTASFERFSGEVAGITSGAMGVWACITSLEAPVVIKAPPKIEQRIVYKENKQPGRLNRW